MLLLQGVGVNRFEDALWNSLDMELIDESSMSRGSRFRSAPPTLVTIIVSYFSKTQEV
jgi:hypothetical protein